MDSHRNCRQLLVEVGEPVLHQRHEVEVYLSLLVPGHPLLDDGRRQVQPLSRLRHRAVVHRALLESVQLVQAAVDRDVRDEVEDVVVLRGHLGVELEQALPETISMLFLFAM